MGDNRIEKLKQQLRDISNSMKLKLGPYLNIKIMRAFNSATKQKSLMAMFILLVSLAKVNYTNAQPPDCVSGTVAYTVFNDSITSSWSSVLDSMEIRPVNLLTGVVGPLMGGKRYWVRKYKGGTVTTNSSYIYGSSALAVDFATSRFYVMTQMSSNLAKDIITIDPVTGTQTVIGTTSSSGANDLDDYHFVKLAGHNSNGYIYAIGVVSDTTLVAADKVNPVIRFPTCGLTPTTGCATASIEILGYLPNTSPLMDHWKLFNGDIAFDNSGNMYFATAAFQFVKSFNRYTDSRLFRVNAADLPTSAGTGVIPMSLVAEYDGLDSTVINGIGFSGTGGMYITTRRYLGQQQTTPPFRSELYSSPTPGNAVLMPAFARPTPGTSASDLTTCFFPAAILAKYDVRLTGQNIPGSSSLKWEVLSNDEVQYFEVQKSRDGSNFETISNIEVVNPDQLNQKYSYTDASAENGAVKYYRIRQVTKSGTRYFSNIVKLNGNKISLNSKIKPNPFVNQVELSIQLATANNIKVRITSQSGAMLFQRSYKGNAGSNNIKIAELGNLAPGVYFIELSSGDEIIREKLIKQ